MSYNSITASRYNVGEATKQDIFDDVKNNQDDHESRIAGLESGGSGSIVIFNDIIDLENSRVGEVKQFLLTQAQMQAKLNSKWKEIDGSSISGEDLASEYGSTLPDGRGRFPRVKDSTRSVGQTESNQNKDHTHNQATYNISGTKFKSTWGSLTGDVGWIQDPSGVGSTQGKSSEAMTVWNEGGTEARPDSLVLGSVIKTSETSFEYALIYRAASAISLAQLTVSNLIAGTSGNLEVDLLKGSALGSVSSVLSSTLTHAFSTGNYATSTNAFFSTTSVSNNDFLVLKIVGTQAGQDRIFVNCSGTST